MAARASSELVSALGSSPGPVPSESAHSRPPRGLWAMLQNPRFPLWPRRPRRALVGWRSLHFRQIGAWPRKGGPGAEDSLGLGCQREPGNQKAGAGRPPPPRRGGHPTRGEESEMLGPEGASIEEEKGKRGGIEVAEPEEVASGQGRLGRGPGPVEKTALDMDPATWGRPGRDWMSQ